MRLRIEYQKGEGARFLGHLEVVRLWERALRRAAFPLVFSQGFNPRPKISFGPALATGVTGKKEYLDVLLEREISLTPEGKTIPSLPLPQSFSFQKAKAVPLSAPALDSLLNFARYEAKVPLSKKLSEADLKEKITLFLANPELKVVRRGKEVDLRPGIYGLQGEMEGEEVLLTFDLFPGSGGKKGVSPAEVLRALQGFLPLHFPEDFPLPFCRTCRTGLYAFRENKLFSPLELYF